MSSCPPRADLRAENDRPLELRHPALGQRRACPQPSGPGAPPRSSRAWWTLAHGWTLTHLGLIGDHFGEDHCVRHHDAHIVDGAQRRRAHADVLHNPFLVLYLDRVAYAERSFQQQIHTAEEILQDVLDG